MSNLCACSELDWSGVDMTQDHHPRCRQVAFLSPLIPRTIEELTAAMEARFEVGEPTSSETAVIGEDYIRLTSGGVLNSSQDLPVWCLNEEKAIELFWFEWLRLAGQSRHSHPSRLYWRSAPIVSAGVFLRPFDQSEVKVFRVSARLLVSDRPPEKKA